MTDRRLVLRPREAARESGLPQRMIYEALRSGRLRSIPRGRTNLIPRRELEAFVEREADTPKIPESAAAARKRPPSTPSPGPASGTGDA